MHIVELGILLLSVLSILFFLMYVVGLLRMPTGFRPNTPVYNRYGEQTGTMKNPGYEETIDEEQ